MMALHMYWPQVVWCALSLLSLGIAMAKHGEPKTDKHSFWWSLVGTFIVAWLLWCGGFFDARAAEPPRDALPYRNELIRTARAQWGLSAPVADFAAQIHQESHWRPGAISPVGAQGLAQFMPTTADWIGGLMPALASREPFNPSWALRALVSYNRWNWQRIDVPSPCERMAMTLSAYNGGLGWVNRDRRLANERGLAADVWFGSTEQVNAGRSAAAWRENRHYPRRILHELAPRYLSWGGASCVS